LLDTSSSFALVLCVDEKSRSQALDRTRPPLPMQPGQLERGTHDYKRNGTTSLFAALDLKTSRVISQFHQRHRSVEFRRFLDVIEVPADLDVHLVLDNYSTHRTATIRNWLAERPRFHVHFTPTYGSWLNLVERWFAELANKRIRRGAFRSVAELESAIREFIKAIGSCRFGAPPKKLVQIRALVLFRSQRRVKTFRSRRRILELQTRFVRDLHHLLVVVRGIVVEQK